MNFLCEGGSSLWIVSMNKDKFRRKSFAFFSLQMPKRFKVIVCVHFRGSQNRQEFWGTTHLQDFHSEVCQCFQPHHLHCFLQGKVSNLFCFQLLAFPVTFSVIMIYLINLKYLRINSENNKCLKIKTLYVCS